MNTITIILLMMFNWCLKLAMGWAAFHFTHWIFNDPAEWAVITIVAVAAVTTSISYSWTDNSGRTWSIK